MGTNLIGMAPLAARRFRFSLPRAHADIYDQFDVLTLDDFSLVMSRAERLVMDAAQDITTESQPNTHLYYVISGQIMVSKRGIQFPLPAGLFVGEVAHLLDTPASATTHLAAGAELIRWDLEHCAPQPSATHGSNWRLTRCCRGIWPAKWPMRSPCNQCR